MSGGMRSRPESGQGGPPGFREEFGGCPDAARRVALTALGAAGPLISEGRSPAQPEPLIVLARGIVTRGPRRDSGAGRGPSRARPEGRASHRARRADGSHSSSMSASVITRSVRISSSAVRMVCSCSSYLSASSRSNQASAPILCGIRSSGCRPNRTPNAKLSESRSSRGNQRLGTSGDRANHLRPFGPWQTRRAGE